MGSPQPQERSKQMRDADCERRVHRALCSNLGVELSADEHVQIERRVLRPIILQSTFEAPKTRARGFGAGAGAGALKVELSADVWRHLAAPEVLPGKETNRRRCHGDGLRRCLVKTK